MIAPLRQLRWEGARHRVAGPSRRERRRKRLLANAARMYAKAGAGWDRFNDEARRLGAGEW